MFILKLNKFYMSNYHPLEVVSCSSGTKLQVVENLKDLI